VSIKIEVAIIGIAICYASYVICTHADGIAFSLAIATVAGLAGYTIAKKS